MQLYRRVRKKKKKNTRGIGTVLLKHEIAKKGSESDAPFGALNMDARQISYLAACTQTLHITQLSQLNMLNSSHCNTTFRVLRTRLA